MSTAKEHYAIESHLDKNEWRVHSSKVSIHCKEEGLSLISISLLILLNLLCLSVEKVEGRNEQSKRWHENDSRRMRSAKNKITNNHSSIAHFDFNRRGWQTFDNWHINEPRVMQYGKVAYSLKNKNGNHHHLLLAGGNEHSLFLYNRPAVSGSWLYTLDTNSWQNVDNDEFQPVIKNPVMVQLCNKIIVLGELHTSKSSRAWIFDTTLLQWQKTQLHGNSSRWSRLMANDGVDREIVGFAIQQPQTNCQCSQSALILSRIPHFQNEMQELQCVYQNGSESYEWINIKSNIAVISDSSFKLTATYSGSIVLYAANTRQFWKFEKRTWTKVKRISSNQQHSQDDSKAKTLGSAVVTTTKSYIVFNIRNRIVLNLDLKSNEITIESVVGDIPDLWYVEVVSTLVEAQNSIIVFLFDTHLSRTSVWKFIYQNKVWFWKKRPSPEVDVSSRIQSSYALKGNCLTVAGGFTDSIFNMNMPYQPSWSGLVWNLDLASMQWWVKVKGNLLDFTIYEASCWIGNCCYIALRNTIDRKGIEAWIYNSSDSNTWKLLLSTSLIKDLSSFSFVAVNKTAAILFGGGIPVLRPNTLFDETWILHLEPKLEWRQLSGDRVYSVRPSARSGHAAVMMQSKMYVFGGMNDSMACLNDLWLFDVNKERWSEVTPVNEAPDVSDTWPCAYSAASTPGQILVTVTCDTASLYGMSRCQTLVLKTWMFIVHLRTWHVIASSPESNNLARSPGGILSKSVYWNGFLLMYDSVKVNIRYLAVRCPAGYTSSNISERPCNFCNKGNYRERIFDDPDCVPCPNGLTTVNIGARHIRECVICDVNHCQHGKCIPDFSEESLRPTCQCYVGFTGSTCQYPTYYLLGAGLILFFAITSAGITAYLLVLKKKKDSDRAWKREVDVLTDVWQIDEDEVTAEERIGSGASGAVYKACYRNIVVAVKKMIAEGLPKSTEDFETEIVFMRTVRHKNIVLFIGAGKSQPEGVPFLVMEYMDRGSLKNVLYNLSIEINYDRKLSFAMDSARGMHFLHSLEPPRIHRDLKSDNLLVSKDWIVKVADFGLGRAINNNSRSYAEQQVHRRNISDLRHIPLLSQREDLSFSGVGTARWCAPELIRREPYDTAVDVYSFGIVLWEIFTRQLPFHHYRFDYEVKDAVIEKERPEIPRDCPHSLATIIRNCWSATSSDRHTFDQVISHLKSLKTSR